MNLDDFDFEQKWDDFKNLYGEMPFLATIDVNANVVQIEARNTCYIDFDVFSVFLKMELIVEFKGLRTNYIINSKQHDK